MDMEQFLSIIRESSPEDWRLISGPAFHQTLVQPNDQVAGLRGHKHAAVLRDDDRISLAWGLLRGDKSADIYATPYPGQEAPIQFLDFFWEGSLMHRTSCLCRDDRCYLPVAKAGVPKPPLRIASLDKDLVRIINRSSAEQADFDGFFERDDVEIIRD